MIAHTILRPDSTLDDVLKACDEAVEQHYASVVVWPCWAVHAARRLSGSEVKVGTVVGFPFGANTTRVKAFETESAIASGAQELDVVINISAVKSGDGTRARRDLEEILEAAHVFGLMEDGQTTMVGFVLETYYLSDRETMVVSELVREIGGEFLVTSTGYAAAGASAAGVRLIRRAVGANIGVKAVGGIRTAKFALELLNSGANRIGTASSLRILEEFTAMGAKESVGSRGRR